MYVRTVLSASRKRGIINQLNFSQYPHLCSNNKLSATKSYVPVSQKQYCNEHTWQNAGFIGTMTDKSANCKVWLCSQPTIIFGHVSERMLHGKEWLHKIVWVKCIDCDLNQGVAGFDLMVETILFWAAGHNTSCPAHSQETVMGTHYWEDLCWKWVLFGGHLT